MLATVEREGLLVRRTHEGRVEVAVLVADGVSQVRLRSGNACAGGKAAANRVPVSGNVARVSLDRGVGCVTVARVD